MPEDLFRLEDYRGAIRQRLAEASVRFRAIEPLSPDAKRDVARRFLTLLHMGQDREVDLIQLPDDILLRRHEADAQG